MPTNCEFPPELDDKQLLAYLDDREANRETALHLEKCSYCREKAKELDRLQKRMTTRLYRITCPSPTELGEYYLRILPPDQMLIISRHLRECPHCTREMNQLKEFMSDLAPGSTGNLLQQTKLLIARLVSGPGGDGVIGETSFALRGESKGPITYETDGVVIVLDIQPANEEAVNILGQLAAEDQDQWTEALVELRQGDELQFSAIVDDLGAFRLNGIKAGLKELRITSKDGSLVVVSNFEVSV